MRADGMFRPLVVGQPPRGGYLGGRRAAHPDPVGPLPARVEWTRSVLRLLEGLREAMEHLERELCPRTVWRGQRGETRRPLDRVSALVETRCVGPLAVETPTGLDRARRSMPTRRRTRKRV